MTNTTATTVVETLDHLNKIWRNNSNAILAANLEPRTGDVDPEATFVGLVARLVKLAEEAQ